MAHVTLVGGTAYNITGGKSMVDGTGYSIQGGKTLVGGTGYDIKFLPDVSTVLNDNDWTTISEISQSGQAVNYWSVGDTKEIVINGAVGDTIFNNLNVWAFILGFNHNSFIEGKKTIHFQIGKNAQIGGTNLCLIGSSYNVYSYASGKFHMNASGDTAGGWESSDMRVLLLGSPDSPTNPVSGSLLAALPNDLRMVMRRTTKYTDNVGGANSNEESITFTEDCLWLLSEYEFGGSSSLSNYNEEEYQEQYQYYYNGNSRVFYRYNDTSSAAIWFLRSPCRSYYQFCSVNASGGIYRTSSNGCMGVAPAFCV